jgi:uncharacterized membrane protein AbrB (regulator of aidB expression)
MTFFRTKTTGSVANTAFSRDIFSDKRRPHMPLYIAAFAVILAFLLPAAFISGREYERNRWVEIDVRRRKR